MNLVIDHVSQFHVVHDADGNSVVKRFAGTTVIQDRLPIRRKTCFLQGIPDIFITSTIENRWRYVNAKLASGHPQVKIEYLTDIHTWWNAHWRKHDIDWSAIRHKRHVFFRDNDGNRTFVAVTAGHLVTDLKLAFLCNINTNHHIYARCQFVACFTSEDFDVLDDSAAAMRNAKRSITYFTRLFTKDCV